MLGVVHTGTHLGVEYRVEADSAGTFTACWHNTGGDRPYWALAGQGYQIPTVDDAVAACRGTIERVAAEREARRNETPARTQSLHALTGLGVEGPGGAYKPDADADSPGPCARCGRSGLWISGAGEYLCVRHQDSY